jgi:redox-sensitive bicupin YhaK (pirin superfamily)
MLPADFDNPPPLEIGPHPHIGLSTVTWLFEGEALHGDSLGTEQVIRAGQLNLMTAGNGIAHSELGVSQGIRGVQMWIAQPEATRHGSSRFEHHADLPVVDLGGAEASLLVGTLGAASSPALVDARLMGAELRMAAGMTVVPSDPRFEYAVVPIGEPLKVGEAVIEPGWLGLVPPGTDELPIESGDRGGHAMVLGGEPLGERIQMWWNFVARTKDEIADAWRAWQRHDTDRFGPVSSGLPRIDAPRPPWLREDA